MTSKSAARLVYDNSHKDILGKFFDNRRMEYVYTFTKNYLSNINPLWLFTDSVITQNDYFQIPNVGLFYLFELPLLIFGFYISAKINLFSRKTFSILLLWILLGILPSALTIESPHANRTFHVLPAYLIFQGVGLAYILIYLHDLKKRCIGLSLLLVSFFVIFVSVLWFVHAYFVNFPRENSQLFEYGIYQAIDFAKAHESEYGKIQISTEYNAIRSSTYYLFKEKYDPSTYIKNGGSISGYYTQPHTYGKYVFIKPNFVYYETGHKEIINTNFYAHDNVRTLYVISPNEYPESKVATINSQYFKMLDDIRYLDGTDALWVMTKIPNK